MPKPLKKQKEIKAYAVVAENGLVCVMWDKYAKSWPMAIYGTRKEAEECKKFWATKLTDKKKVLPITLKL